MEKFLFSQSRPPSSLYDPNMLQLGWLAWSLTSLPLLCFLCEECAEYCAYDQGHGGEDFVAEGACYKHVCGL